MAARLSTHLGVGGLGARLRFVGWTQSSSSRSSPVFAIAAGAAAAAAVASASVLSRRNDSQSHLIGGERRLLAAPPTPLRVAVASCETAAPVAAKPDLVEEIPAGVNLLKSKVRLYQFESCPFCRKARGCLDYNNIPYEIVEVHPLSKAETNHISPDYKKVPVLEVDSQTGTHVQLRDSKTIVRALLGKSGPPVSSKVQPPQATSSTGKMWTAADAEGTVEEQWIKWTDKVLVQCIVLNVYRTMSESAETFQYLLTHPEWPWYAQRSAQISGTAVMWVVCWSRKRKFAVEDERKALYESLEAFTEEVKRGGGSFLSGSKPGAVDFNVYGILRSTESCQTEKDMLRDCAAIAPWWDAMNKVVGESCGTHSKSITRGQ